MISLFSYALLAPFLSKKSLVDFQGSSDINTKCTNLLRRAIMKNKILY